MWDYLPVRLLSGDICVPWAANRRYGRSPGLAALEDVRAMLEIVRAAGRDLP